MAAAILISTFGCANGLSLAGARVYYAMSQDGLFFKSVGKLHPKYKTPGRGLLVQACWTALLCVSGSYSQLLDYIIFAVLVFYILTIRRPVRSAREAAKCEPSLQGAGIPRSARALHRHGFMDMYRIIAIQAPIHMAGPGACSARNPGISLLVAAFAAANAGITNRT